LAIGVIAETATDSNSITLGPQDNIATGESSAAIPLAQPTPVIHFGFLSAKEIADSPSGLAGELPTTAYTSPLPFGGWGGFESHGCASSCCPSNRLPIHRRADQGGHHE
jgi:hypothetical protein